MRHMPWIAKIKKILSMCHSCSINEAITGLDYKTKFGEEEFGIPMNEMPVADGSAFLMRALGDRSTGPRAAQAILGSYNLSAKFEGYDHKSRSATVSFTLRNRMGVESLTRKIAKDGYNGKHLKDPTMTGVSAQIKEMFPNGQNNSDITVRWQEDIPMRFPVK
ncbi:hypothetical protein ACWGLP_09895 [Streptomyces lydicus]